MRIGLAARWLQLPSGGAREYTFNLIQSLLQIDDRNEYFVFHGDSACLGSFPSATEVLLPGRNKLWWDYGQLPAGVKRRRIDLLWTPSYIIPLRIGCKAVASVLDLAYYTLPRSYQLTDVLYMRLAMPRSFRRADALLAISTHTQADLLRLFPFTRSKVTVTPLAPHGRYRKGLEASVLQAARSKYFLPEHFVFYAGSISPRKGLPYLLEAFARLKRLHNLPHRLVFTGGWRWGNTDLDALIDRLNIRSEMLILGDISVADMPALYTLADLFVYPSLYEGFGLPVLEAMACGCPVVCSNLTSLPEVAGEAAIQVDPRDVPAMAEAMYRVLSNATLCHDLIGRGFIRAATFTWEATARKTLEVFEQVGPSQISA